MKKINILLTGLFLMALSSSCSMFGLDLQENYDYKKKTLDPHINISARAYLEQRGKAAVIASDTVFKWMQLGLEYAGINLSEYEQSGRTFLFLSNNAIRVRNASTGAITAGMWFDFPIYEKNPDGTQILLPDGSPKTHPATSWKEYPVEDVKNYFLYLILKGDYGFNNATTTNATLETLLPPGSIASNKSKLGYYLAGTTPNLSPTGARIMTLSSTPQNGFDPEGKINMALVNNQDAPLRINNATNCNSSGIIATNGQIHAAATTVYPFRF